MDDDLSIINQAWLGQLCDASHCLAVGRVDPVGDVEWSITIYRFMESSVWCWRCTFVNVIGTELMYLDTERVPAEPCFITVWDTGSDTIRVCTLQWPPWFWQCNTIQAGALPKAPAVRPFVTRHGIATSLKELAILYAGWRLSRTALPTFALYWYILVNSSMTLLELVFAMIQQGLCLNDIDTLAIVYLRIVYNDGHAPYSETLLEMEEAVELIGRYDREKVAQAQASAKSRTIANDTFKRESSSKSRAARMASGGVGVPASGASSSSASVSPPRRRLPFHCTQQRATVLLPPGCTIWQSRVGYAWAGHDPLDKRVRASFAKCGGSDGALKECLKKLWAQHLLRHCLTNDHCTVEGLM